MLRWPIRVHKFSYTHPGEVSEYLENDQLNYDLTRRVTSRMVGGKIDIFNIFVIL